MIDYDLELRRYQPLFQDACEVGRQDRVLDLGCGTGETTRAAARAASSGSVLGIDRSEAMLQTARALTQAQALHNVTYACADIEEARFAPGQHDLAISRFGTMFFAQPGAAFTSIREALTASGRLVMLVWQARERNDWVLAIERALKGEAPGSWQPFSLGEPRSTQDLLHRAGFTEVTFTEVHEAVCYGPDAESAFAFVSQFALVQETLAHSRDRARSLRRLHTVLAEHQAHDGVWLDARAWIVAAH